MPKLNIDDFDTEPHVGNKVKVIGKVKSIDEDTGEVEVSYDSVTIVKKHKSDNNDNNDNTESEGPSDNTDMNENTPMDLDAALARNFNYTR